MRAHRRVAAGAAALLVALWAWPATADPPRLLLQDQAWLAPTPDPAAALTRAPRECLARRTPQIEAGRAVFAAPTTLGGPAARAGLSCAACHVSGRANARFLLPELTDRPGAADVTSEWASKVRGDGHANPVPIPDLAGAAQRPAYGAARDPSLRAFIRGVTVEEFQGADDPAVLDALTAAADPSLDPRLAGATLSAARHLIGRVVERAPPRGPFVAARADLARLAVDLGAIRTPDGAAAPAAVAAALPGWRARLAAAAAPLRRHARDTYFNEGALRRALAAPAR